MSNCRMQLNITQHKLGQGQPLCMYAVSKLVQVINGEGLSLQKVVERMLQAVLPVLPFLQRA